MTIERETHWAAMDVVLVCSFALAVVHTGRTTACMRSALSLREFETAVSTLVECAHRRDVHLVRREHFQHVLLIVFCLRARVVRAALAAAVRDLASLASTCFFYEVRALEDDKASGAVEADLAD